MAQLLALEFSSPLSSAEFLAVARPDAVVHKNAPGNELIPAKFGDKGQARFEKGSPH